ncbi:hypothetical protein, partial [Noviherbaspirillum sp.]|uniref:hypothetical protein n=1 Tax=Noviherbaspirillum sp. TaxID=1926288 RepID=UPI002D2777AC
MGWSSYFWLRSAGFPFSHLERLGVLSDAPELALYEAARADLAAVEDRLSALVGEHAPQAATKLARKFDACVPVAAADLPEQVREPAADLLLTRLGLLEQVAASLRRL